MSQSISLNSQHRYEIKVSINWMTPAWFGEAKICLETLADDDQLTTVSDVIMDQAGLVGLIRQLHGLGSMLLFVRQVDVALFK